jgi:hypothetical protein
MRMFRWTVLAGALSVSACSQAISGNGDNIARLEQARTAEEPVAWELGPTGEEQQGNHTVSHGIRRRDLVKETCR